MLLSLAHQCATDQLRGRLRRYKLFHKDCMEKHRATRRGILECVENQPQYCCTATNASLVGHILLPFPPFSSIPHLSGSPNIVASFH